MEKIDLKKESLLLAALQKEVADLKKATEVSSLKEQMIGAIMQEQDKTVLEKAAKVLRDVLFPKKPGNVGGVPVEQGNE